jgi:predicted membrane protein
MSYYRNWKKAELSLLAGMIFLYSRFLHSVGKSFLFWNTLYSKPFLVCIFYINIIICMMHTHSIFGQSHKDMQSTNQKMRFQNKPMPCLAERSSMFFIYK